MEKPDPPYPDFPLYPHMGSGQWCKRIRGKLHYFGSLRAPWQEALQKYLDKRDHVQAGRTPPSEAETVADMLNRYLSRKKESVLLGEISDDFYAETERVTDAIADHLGTSTPLEIVKDLAGLRGKLAIGKKGQPVGVSTHRRRLSIARSVFLHAQLPGLNYKTELRAPPQRALRKLRREAGERFYNADEIRALVVAADDQFASMLVLGLSAAYGPQDVSTVPGSAVKGDFLVWHRPKTEVTRKAWLWREVTVRPPYKGWDRHRVNREFKKVAKVADVSDHGFYGLRRSFETVAASAEVNQAVIDCVMGHSRHDMASVYRRRIFDQSIQRVGQFVRDWYLGSVTLD